MHRSRDNSFMWICLDWKEKKCDPAVARLSHADDFATEYDLDWLNALRVY